MSIKKWFRDNLTAIALSLSSVEKSVLSQKTDTFSDGIDSEERHQDDSLANALIRGEINQEVKDLRWRTYKVLKASEKLSLEFSYRDSDGDVYYNTKTSDFSLIRKVKLDTYDDYPLEIIVRNEKITISKLDAINDSLELHEEIIKNVDNSVTHGEISAKQYFIDNKPERQIKILRPSLSKFNIEDYTIKLNIRTITETEKLLEFYVSKYFDEYNRTSRLFISEIKKAIINPRSVNILDLTNVMFVSNNTFGTYDFKLYTYNIISFDKIIEFDGHYVIKFKANVDINGEDILNDFIEEGLEKKYENKAPRM